MPYAAHLRCCILLSINTDRFCGRLFAQRLQPATRRLTIAESSIFWDTLLQLIEEGKVVPIAGQDLLIVDTPVGPKLLYTYLAEQLADYLGVSAENLSLGSELNDVAYRFLAQSNQVEDIYPALKAVASKAEALPVPEPLLQLADIRPLQLFVTTTFDSFLTRAINQKRFGGNLKTKVFAYSPTEATDLPGDMKSLNFSHRLSLAG